MTSICKVSLFYLVSFKRYDNWKFVFWATWFQNMTKSGNFITWCEFKTYQKCEKLNFEHWVKVSCWLHLYFKSYQKKDFGRVVYHFTHGSLLSQNLFFAVTIYGFWISNEHIFFQLKQRRKNAFQQLKTTNQTTTTLHFSFGVS